MGIRTDSISAIWLKLPEGSTMTLVPSTLMAPPGKMMFWAFSVWTTTSGETPYWASFVLESSKYTCSSCTPNSSTFMTPSTA